MTHETDEQLAALMEQLNRPTVVLAERLRDTHGTDGQSAALDRRTHHTRPPGRPTGGAA